jgi:hypothetical protein
MAHLLVRNGESMTASWQAFARTDGRVGFALKYVASVDGMEPEFFKYVCESMVTEVTDFDMKAIGVG